MSDQETDELLRLSTQNNGLLMPEHVVDAARAVDSPLHKHFEWDDTEAARLHRLQQARELIRVCVRVIPSIQRETRVFVSLSSDRENGGGYRRTIDVLSDEQQRAVLIEDCLRQLVRLQQKYGHLRELAQLWSDVSKHTG